MNKEKLGIIAGGGDIPSYVIKACIECGRPFFVLAFNGHAEREKIDASVPQAWIRLGAAGEGFKLLHEQEVKEIVMIGKIKRPSLIDLCPDWRAAKFFARVGTKALGDNSLLSAVVEEMEAEGFKVTGVDAILNELLAVDGVYGKYVPDAQALTDIERAFEVAKGIGALDVGQGAVVQEGIVLAVEAVEGTDAMLARCKDLKREGLGGVLVKVKKPNQERRVDLPTIGVDTIKNAYCAGLRGVAVEKNSALIVDRSKVIAKADELGLFVVGIK